MGLLSASRALGMRILDKIFGGPRLDQRDTNHLILDLAEHGNRPADLRELYRRLPSMEVYAKVLEANFSLQDGARHVIGSGEVLKIQNATLPSGHSLAQFFVDKSDSRLQPNYIGISPREACQMALKIDGFSGLIFCNPTGSWVALLKPELERLLQKELAEPGAAPRGVPRGVTHDFTLEIGCGGPVPPGEDADDPASRPAPIPADTALTKLRKVFPLLFPLFARVQILWLRLSALRLRDYAVKCLSFIRVIRGNSPPPSTIVPLLWISIPVKHS